MRGGDEVELGAMCEYELRWDAEPRCEDAAKASDLDHGPYDPSGGVHAVKAPEVDSDGGGADQWAELLYYWRTHASQDESSRLNVMMQQGRDSEVADVCRRIRAEALAAQSAEHARICERCRLCYTCTTSAVAPLPPLPYFVFPEDHSGSLWRERTSRCPSSLARSPRSGVCPSGCASSSNLNHPHIILAFRRCKHAHTRTCRENGDRQASRSRSRRRLHLHPH